MKRALITGGTRGIGLAVCARFAQAGYLVTALYAHDEADAERARRLLPSVEFIKADVSNENEVKAVFDRFTSLDVLVNNAGVSLYKQVQDVTKEEWNAVTGVNAGGAFLCVKHAVKKMLDRGGAIINVTSVWGDTGGSCESVYSASKGAVVAFSKALAKELAPSQITVNCVSPGVVDTAMMARFSQEEKQAIANEIPLGRFATPEEIASAVVFLSENRYITGQVLAVNGGMNV